MLKTIVVNSGAGININVTTGASSAALIAASEEIRNTMAISNQIATNDKPICHDNPSITPSAVATPFPPLNEKNTG